MPPKQRPGQLGRYWLSKRPGSDNWCRTWFDPAARQTRRESLGASDLEDAQRRFAQWFAERGDIGKTPAREMTLARVAQRYYAQHACHLKGAGAGVQARNLEIVIERVGELTIAEFTRAKQEALARDLARKYRPATIRRIFDSIFAAMNRAMEGEELDGVPRRIRLPDSPPREFVATMEQLAAFWNAPKPPQLQTMFVLLLATGARPSSILELTRFQCSLEDGFIDLNPPGRVQTKKRRAVVPMCALARAWIAAAGEGPLVHYNGRPIVYINQSWRRVRREAGLPEAFTPGAMRHTIATHLRRRGVPMAQISGLLGHTMPRAKTTERYAKYEPNFMAETVAALDAFFADLARAAKSTLNPVRSSGVLMAEGQSVSSQEKAMISGDCGGRGRVRTCDPYGVNVVLYR